MFIIVTVFVVMARYEKVISWVIEHCRDPVPNGATVSSCGHVEDAGPTMVQVGRFEFKLNHPLARETWKSCQEGILLQFKGGGFFEDGVPTWIYEKD